VEGSCEHGNEPSGSLKFAAQLAASEGGLSSGKCSIFEYKLFCFCFLLFSLFY
jgi:hypothetical protein